MQKINNNSRRDFLRKIPIALVSISVFSIFKSKKSYAYSEKKYDLMPKSEADEIIKNDNFRVSIQMNPLPAPFGQKYIK